MSRVGPLPDVGISQVWSSYTDSPGTITAQLLLDGNPVTMVDYDALNWREIPRMLEYLLLVLVSSHGISAAKKEALRVQLLGQLDKERVRMINLWMDENSQVERLVSQLHSVGRKWWVKESDLIVYGSERRQEDIRCALRQDPRIKTMGDESDYRLVHADFCEGEGTDGHTGSGRTSESRD